jgi:hypothetical protein
MKKRDKFTVSDGELVLNLEPAEDAFDMARDAIKALRASRAKLHRKLAVAKGAP